MQTATSSTTLADRLRERIRREGAITFRDWMAAALYDEHHGYYRRPDRSRWGREGDYRTSPERSSLFASTFARYFVELYRTLGNPSECTILEAGAGAGKFSLGILETLRERFPEVFAATCLVVDEVGANSDFRARFDSFKDRVQFGSVQNSESLNPGIIFSNELFDSFPIHRVTVSQGELQELYVDAPDDKDFSWITGPLSSPELAEYFNEPAIELQPGQIAEVNLEVKTWMKNAANRLAKGYLITIDYGAEATDLFDSRSRLDGTVRGFHRHRLVDDVLARPGEQDITSTVDWTFVKRVGDDLGFRTVKLERQDQFLLAAGLLEELELQSQRAGTDAERLSLSTTAREMILPDGMAASFQVLVQTKGLP